jgi:hypothetical protein
MYSRPDLRNFLTPDSRITIDRRNTSGDEWDPMQAIAHLDSCQIIHKNKFQGLSVNKKEW